MPKMLDAIGKQAYLLDIGGGVGPTTYYTSSYAPMREACQGGGKSLNDSGCIPPLHTCIRACIRSSVQNTHDPLLVYTRSAERPNDCMYLSMYVHVYICTYVHMRDGWQSDGPTEYSSRMPDE